MVNIQKSESEPKQIFGFVGYQYDLLHGLVRLPKTDGSPFCRSVIPPDQPNLQGQTINVPNRTAHGIRETGAPVQASYETHPVAPRESFEGARITGKGNHSSKGSSPSHSVVDQGDKYPSRSTSTSFVSHPPSLYRCLKRRFGCPLRRLHGKRVMVGSSKLIAHKVSGVKRSPLTLKSSNMWYKAKLVWLPQTTPQF